uniref:Uncharacterized protein n=1 Tax=Physcomitrium patens TaxID=3218 RepID=A0A2K1KCP2_PHYPA|nr:hypothetical protein PHYPA_010737 [Physcomitrium patens]
MPPNNDFKNRVPLMNIRKKLRASNLSSTSTKNPCDNPHLNFFDPFAPHRKPLRLLVMPDYNRPCNGGSILVWWQLTRASNYRLHISPIWSNSMF